jgi:microcystin-dependent protein
MTFVRPKARILERSISAGNGPYTLAGAVDGTYNTFASFMAIGDTTEASIVEPGVAFWTGVVTYSATNQIALTTVEETKGTFASGTKEIFAGGLSSRALLREDMSGAIVSGGTSTAYTVTSFRAYDTLARLDGKAIAFTPHVTNGATVTLNVDGLGAKPLWISPGNDIQSNVMIAGTPYTATYNNNIGSTGGWVLHALAGNAYGIPLAAGMDYWGGIAPSSAFVFPVGQAISRATYSALFALMGTAFGSGDGSTTFNLPDKRGRLSTAANNMGGAGSSAWPGLNFGSSGGVAAASMSLGASNMAPYTAAGAVTNGLIVTPAFAGGTAVSTLNYNVGGSIVNVPVNPQIWGAFGTPGVNNAFTQQASSFAGTSNGGSSAAFSVAQPYISCNYIMRVV